jgi:hypothetical protein
MDLSRFSDACRLGRRPYDPQMLVALPLYAYARGSRSSRGIERACQEDVAFKVITIDGTKIKANASMDQNRSHSWLVKDILREAEEEDQREDQLYGD